MKLDIDNIKTYAPVILFVYARPAHTQKVINALKINILASQTDLIVFSDAPKSESMSDSVKEVRKVLETIEGFKTIKIIERKENYGLAKSIIEGVSSVIETYGRAIILEDDIVTSKYFLSFMNEALEKYQKSKKVWHISGWNYPIENTDIGDTFFWRVMNCWGWATWQDRWQYFEKDPSRLVESWNRRKIKQFNLDGAHDFWTQVVANANGQLNTWAIFWYATIFEKQGFCLNPTETFVKNIGIDGSGENCDDKDVYVSSVNNKYPLVFSEKIAENTIATERIRRFYLQHKLSFITRVKYKLKRIFSL
ncbi:sugar transferase [Entomomonas sp. E2T0]|uniref:sugar transferase n=1 Tax=Entomomonas sp. E2T0 TaxID=2930213 RepID=UPI0022284528|nr:sugar transferase [Entomomonas sp. E2T0]UYZ82607.1 sugar transferase [Entomomonas sp. E2T0]